VSTELEPETREGLLDALDEARRGYETSDTEIELGRAA
jgi:hypothetical protein